MKFLRFIIGLAAEIGSWMLGIVIVLLIGDIVGRNIDKPLHGVTELAVFVMVAAVYLGFGHCEERYEFVRVDSIVAILPSGLKHIANVFAYIVALITMTIVVYATFSTALRAYIAKEAVSGTVPIVTYPVKFAIFLGCLLYLVQIFVNLMQQLRATDVRKEH